MSSGLGKNLNEPQLIPAKSDFEMGSTVLWPFQVATLATHELGSTCVQVAVIVQIVKFSDGTEWRQDDQQNISLWKDSTSGNFGSTCQPAPESAATLKTIGATWSDRPHTNSGTVESYSVSCPVEFRNDGKQAAVCAW